MADSALVQKDMVYEQDFILCLKSKNVLAVRCLMSLIGLLASVEKILPKGHIHMSHILFHLKKYWRYPWGGGGGGRLHINVLELNAVSLALKTFKDQCQNQTVLVATDSVGCYRQLNSRMIKKIRQSSCLIIVIAPDWPEMARFWGLVQRSHSSYQCQQHVSKVPQLCVSQQSTTSQPPRLMSRSSKNKASLWKWQRELLPLKGHQQGPSTSPSGSYLKNGAEKIRWISPLHL